MQKRGLTDWRQGRWEGIREINKKGKEEIRKGAGKEETEKTGEGNKDKLKRR